MFEQYMCSLFDLYSANDFMLFEHFRTPGRLACGVCCAQRTPVTGYPAVMEYSEDGVAVTFHAADKTVNPVKVRLFGSYMHAQGR